MADRYHELQKQLGQAAAEGDFAKAAELRTEIQATWAADKDNPANAPAPKPKNG